MPTVVGTPKRTRPRSSQLDAPRSSRSFNLITLLCVPPIRYIPCWSRPYFSIASQHFVTIGGTSTSSRVICSARSTPNVGRPLSDRCVWARLGELPGWWSTGIGGSYHKRVGNVTKRNTDTGNEEDIRSLLLGVHYVEGLGNCYHRGHIRRLASRS